MVCTPILQRLKYPLIFSIKKASQRTYFSCKKSRQKNFYIRRAKHYRINFKITALQNFIIKKRYIEMSIINEISEFVQKGRSKNVKALVEQALAEGVNAKEILDNGLLDGMLIIGGKFRRNEVYVPEVLVAARAMNAGITVLEPKLIEIGVEPVGKAVIGTVKGDLHDIGKNIVTIMMKGAGFEILDLGVDVPSETFVEKAEEFGADVICMSALLTTTMDNMKEVIDLLKAKGVREKYIVMVGGAPITDEFASQIGADHYTLDAASCAELAKKTLLARK